jgi:hypothetical protein
MTGTVDDFWSNVLCRAVMDTVNVTFIHPLVRFGYSPSVPTNEFARTPTVHDLVSTMGT